MSIARLDTPTINEGTSSAMSHSFSVSSGSDRMLVVICTWEHSDPVTVSAISYGGQSMTRATGAQHYVAPYSNGVEIWYILDAGIEAESGDAISVTSTQNPNYWDVTAASFSGVNQSGGATTVTDTATNTGASPLSLDVTESNGGLVVASIVSSALTTCSWNATMSEKTDNQYGSTATSSFADRLSTTSASVTVEGTPASYVRDAGASAAIAPAAGAVAGVAYYQHYYASMVTNSLTGTL